MKSIFRHSICGVCAILALGSNAAINPTQEFDGYFRVQNLSGKADNSAYVQVRGPFTAQPDQTYEQTRTEAGSIFRIHAVPDMSKGYLTYDIRTLRSQGIDAIGTPISDEEYEQTVIDALMNSDNPVYGLVRAGFEHGYVSIGRATVSTVLLFVAARLQKETSQPNQDELYEVARDFNRNVTANLDLSIRLLPCEEADGVSYRLFYDTPDLKAVSDWYTDESTEYTRARKASFEKGMDAMSTYLSKLGMPLEIFTAADVAEMKSYGYDISAKYELDAQGNCQSSFRQIFADPDLLFNWLKLTMVKLTDPERTPNVTIAGYNLPELARKLQEHYLTKTLVEYLPRLHTGTRYFLISGRVVNGNGDLAAGAGQQHKATSTLGFANATEVEVAADFGKWLIKPVNDTDNSFCINAIHSDNDYSYNAHYFDFPIKAVNPATMTFLTLAPADEPVNVKGVDVYYSVLKEVSGTVPALTPFMARCEYSGMEDNLVVPDYNTVYPAAANGLQISDDVTASQRSLRAETAPTASDKFFRGVLLDTPLNPTDMKNMWDMEYHEETAPVYRMTTWNSNNNSSLYYTKNTDPVVAANEAFLMPEPNPNNAVLVGEPDNDTVTALGTITIDPSELEPGVLYNLQGIPVDTPRPGEIYILDGRKILMR